VSDEVPPSEQLLAIALSKGFEVGRDGGDRRRLPDRRSGTEPRKLAAKLAPWSRRAGGDRRQAERRLSDRAPEMPVWWWRVSARRTGPRGPMRWTYSRHRAVGQPAYARRHV